MGVGPEKENKGTSSKYKGVTGIEVKKSFFKGSEETSTGLLT